MINLPLALEVARGTQHSHRLIHHPLANTQVVIDPLLEVLVIGDFVGVETGAVKDPTRCPPGFGGCARDELISLLAVTNRVDKIAQ